MTSKSKQRIGLVRIIKVLEKLGYNWKSYTVWSHIERYAHSINVGFITFNFRYNPEQTYTYLTRYEVNTLIRAVINFKNS